ncbi:MAG: hypothetical protein ABI371_09845 [Gelidibacter sp.]
MAFKSHFKFSNSQRNGIFLLATLIVVFQCVYAFVDFSSEDIPTDTVALEKFRHQVDSLKRITVANNKPKTYPFNPNYITDFKGYTLGMSTDEIDRLLEFRDGTNGLILPNNFNRSLKFQILCWHNWHPCLSSPIGSPLQNLKVIGENHLKTQVIKHITLKATIKKWI